MTAVTLYEFTYTDHPKHAKTVAEHKKRAARALKKLMAALKKNNETLTNPEYLGGVSLPERFGMIKRNYDHIAATVATRYDVIPLPAGNKGKRNKR